MTGAQLLLLFVTLSLFARGAKACVYLYGARHEVPHYSYGYVGLDWPEEFSGCSGNRQSPIHIPGHTSFARVVDGQESRFNYGQLASNGTNIKIMNNGHTVQVVMPADFQPNVTVAALGPLDTTKLISKFNATATAAVQRVQITPAQFHFHVRSEHVIDGKEYPLEMHIVNWVWAPTLPACGVGGCATVVGILFQQTEELRDAGSAAEANPFLDLVFSSMPLQEGQTSYIPANKVLDFDEILPADRSYMTYEGSLTTPPCTEGILWHVLSKPMKITRDQLHRFELAVGATQCRDTPGAVRLLRSAPPAASPAPATQESSLTFEVPAYATDAADGQSCRKLAGQNYREVQDRQSRPILFYAAPGLCDAQLTMLKSRSKILGKLLYESNSSDSITLAQYNDIVDTQLTKEAGCAGLTSAAGPVSAAATVLTRALLALLLLLWLLADA